MTSVPRYSVIIPTFQRCASVGRALAALARQSVPAADYEVIVSIDGSEDGTREAVASFAAPYALTGLWHANRGRAAAVNAGLAVAQGELVVLLDDDMEPAPGWLAAHGAAHAANERRGVMGAAPISFDARARPVVRHYVGLKFNAHMQHLANARSALSLRDFYSGNFSIRRAVLASVGAFDEAFRIYGNEDLELSLRLTRAGVTLVFAPEALAHQHYTKDFRGLARDTIAKGQTAVLLAGLHPEAFGSLQLSQSQRASWPWRTLRGGLIRLSSGAPAGAGPLIALVQALEWLPRAPLRLLYRLVLDYAYWLGVEAALRANRRERRGLLSLRGPTWA